MGGVEAIYVIDRVKVEAVTVTSDKISAISFEDTDDKFVKLNIPPEVAYFTSTPQIDRSTGSNYIQTVLGFNVNRMTTRKRIEFEALRFNDLAFLVKDNNGSVWYLGKDHPVLASGGESGTGTGYGDRNGYGIELIDRSANYPLELNIGTGTGQIDLDDITTDPTV